MKERKPKTCKGCGEQFTPERSFQCVCNAACSYVYIKNKKSTEKEAKQRLQTKTAREALKTRSDFLKEAQTAFNAWVRQRDVLEPCISCGRHHAGKYDAGHYRTVGAAPHLRFNEDNNNKQCSPCNRMLSGNILEYRIGLIKKIGVERVESLESNNEPAKLTIPQIKEIKQIYKARLKQLKAE